MRQLIQFTRNGCNTLLGNFGPGDRLRCAPDMARHLVEQARCAKYVSDPQVQEVKPVAPQPSAAPRARRRKVLSAGETHPSLLE